MQDFSLIPGFGNEFAGLINAAFGSGEPGVWYRPDDPKTQFTTEIATTQVASVGNTVGLAVDQSRGAVLGAELRASGTVALVGTATAATYNTTTGEANCTRVDLSNQSSIRFSGLVPGGYYAVDVQNTGAQNVAGRSGNESGLQMITYTSGNRFTRYLYASPAGLISLTATSAGSAAFTVHSIKHLLGNHAHQATAAKRPLFARVPARGRVNLFINTGFAGAVAGSPGTAPTSWPNVQSTGTIAEYDPALGKLRLVTSDTRRTFQQAANMPINSVQITRLKVNVISGTLAVGRLASASTLVATGASTQYTIDGSNVTSSTVLPLGESLVTFQQTTTTDAWTCNLIIGNGTANIATADIEIWEPQIELGSTATNYQRVGAGAFDVTEVGQQTLTGWLFDGVDDNLETNTIDLTTTDEMTVAAGHRRANTTATELLLEHSTSSSAANGSFAIIHGSGGANQWRSKGTTLVDLNKSVTPTENIVITGVSKISTPTTTLRINGVQEALSVSSQGTGTFLSHKTYYGSRGGTSFFYTGYLFGLMFRGTATALPLLQRIEKYIGTKTGKNL